MGRKDYAWGEQMNKELRETGITVLLVDGDPISIQSFVEDLSQKIGGMVDWGYSCGVARINVFEQNLHDAVGWIMNKSFLSKYCRDYDMDNITEELPYFIPWNAELGIAGCA